MLLVSAVAFCGAIPPQPRDGEGPGAVVPILIYHSVRPYITTDSRNVKRYIATPETLERELSYLREKGYVSISFDDLANHLTFGTPLPARPVILSFDDDWESQYLYALPLLAKYSFTATFFIWVSVVGTKHHMTWDEVRALSEAGMWIGCHTITHPYLTRIKKDKTLRKEIAGAKKIIEDHVGKPVTTIAYPFGQYNERVVAVTREAGFTSARSTWPGVLHTRQGLLSLTGILRTDAAMSLIDAMEKYLAEMRAAGSGW
jgi:peptidoglycan/xylan/chitin deacetylase (PgdA/CDA1 family)